MTNQPLEWLCEVNPDALGPATAADFEFRYLDISSVTRGKIDWRSTRVLRFADAPSRARRVATKGDVLLCTVRPALQSHARITGVNERLICSTGFAVLRPHELGDSGFVYHQLFSDQVSAQLRALETGSNYPAVNESDVRRVVVYAPPLADRARIAAVQDTVDEAIAKTEAVIAKLKEERAGLLHDLLTRGLDGHGQLRDPIVRPGQFQESPLGRIPKQWACEPLQKHTLCSAYGPRFPGECYSERGNVALLRTTDMDASGNLSLEQMPLAELLVEEFKPHFLEEGDFLISRSGTCGIGAVFPGFRLPVLPGAFLIRFRLAETLLPEFLQLYVNSEPGVKRIANLAEGGVQKNIRGSAILRSFVPIPSPTEQEAILHMVHSLDAQSTTEHRECAKLRDLKSGLTNDLLTGRVRVPQSFAVRAAEDRP